MVVSKKMKSGERWRISTRGAANLWVELLEDVNPLGDTFFKAQIVTGTRTYMTREDAVPGDVIDLRTSLTRFIEKLDK